MDHTYAVIMAGGSGTRLWPVSRKRHPKHLLPLLGKRSLFQDTVERLQDFVPAERILVVAAGEQAEELARQSPHIPAGNFLLEPMPRGTASVVGLAAAVLYKRDPQAVMLVLPSDHFIRRSDLFQQMMKAAVPIARKKFLVTLGIVPTFPATGYGYIQRGTLLAEKVDFPVYRVLKFKEKPSVDEARKMIAGGDHSWNSGMFIWRADRILEEIGAQMPELKAVLDQVGAAWGSSRQETVLESLWPGLRSETIDYGIMEHARKVAVLPAEGLEWSDVGSWDSLFHVLPADKDGNVVIEARHVSLDSHGSLVRGGQEKLIVTIGVEDLIIVDTEDALLICRKDQAQQLRRVIDDLKNSDREHYL